MAWPFPDRTHNAHACETTYNGRTSGCLGAWKAEEQKMAGLFMTVVAMVFIWQVCVNRLPQDKGFAYMLGSFPSSPSLFKRTRGCTGLPRLVSLA